MLLKIDFQGLSDLKKNLGEISSLSTNLTPLLQSPRLPIIMARATERTITGQNGYKPLVKKYATSKAKAVGSKPILVRTGAMLARLKNGQGFQFTAGDSNRSIKIMIADPIARFHQLGSGRLPQRPVLVADEQMAKEITEAVNDALGEQLREKLKRR